MDPEYAMSPFLVCASSCDMNEARLSKNVPENKPGIVLTCFWCDSFPFCGLNSLGLFSNLQICENEEDSWRRRAFMRSMGPRLKTCTVFFDVVSFHFFPKMHIRCIFCLRILRC
jgi:hypothetical protein